MYVIVCYDCHRVSGPYRWHFQAEDDKEHCLFHHEVRIEQIKRLRKKICYVYTPKKEVKKEMKDPAHIQALIRLKEIRELAIHALETDGDHHKQWYLERILHKANGGRVLEALRKAGSFEEGIAP